jgi:hypothetical protein
LCTSLRLFSRFMHTVTKRKLSVSFIAFSCAASFSYVDFGKTLDLQSYKSGVDACTFIGRLHIQGHQSHKT